MFKVQATTQHGHDEDRLITVGKVKIDMAQFAMLGHKEHHTVLQMPFSAGKSFTQALPFGQLRLKISAHMVKVSSMIDSLCKFCCCNRLSRFCYRLLHSLSLIATMHFFAFHSHQYSTQHAPRSFKCRQQPQSCTCLHDHTHRIKCVRMHLASIPAYLQCKHSDLHKPFKARNGLSR